MEVTGFPANWLPAHDAVHHATRQAAEFLLPGMKNASRGTTLHDRNLSAFTRAGVINNLKDGFEYFPLPFLHFNQHFTLGETGMVKVICPAAWESDNGLPAECRR